MNEIFRFKQVFVYPFRTIIIHRLTIEDGHSHQPEFVDLQVGEHLVILYT